jgi:hypothetical protein
MIYFFIDFRKREEKKNIKILSDSGTDWIRAVGTTLG